jgi:hypothetical protein
MAYSTEDEIREQLWRQRHSPDRRGASPRSFAEAPAEGADARFDDKVRQLVAQKAIVREECWAAFGGSGEAAKVGDIPDFDARVDQAFEALRDKERQKQARADEDFERAVRSEMDAIVGDVKDMMREQDRRAGPRADDRRLRDAGRDDRFQDTGRSFQDTGRSFQDTGRSFQDTGRSFRDDRFQESKREESKNGGFFGADRSDGAGFFGGDSRPNSGASFGAAPVGAAPPQPQRNASSRRFTAQRTASSIVFG